MAEAPWPALGQCQRSSEEGKHPQGQRPRTGPKDSCGDLPRCQGSLAGLEGESPWPHGPCLFGPWPWTLLALEGL